MERSYHKITTGVRSVTKPQFETNLCQYLKVKLKEFVSFIATMLKKKYEDDKKKRN